MSKMKLGAPIPDEPDDPNLEALDSVGDDEIEKALRGNPDAELDDTVKVVKEDDDADDDSEAEEEESEGEEEDKKVAKDDKKKSKEPAEGEEEAPEGDEDDAEGEEGAEDTADGDEAVPEGKEKAAKGKGDASDVLRLRLEESDARAKHFESLAGRLGGKVDHLTREFEALKTGRAAPAGDEGDPERTAEAPRQGMRPAAEAYVVSTAIRQAASDFIDAHPDAKDQIAEVQGYMKKAGVDPRYILGAEDPARAQADYRALLEEAYWAVTAESRAKLRADAEKRSFDSTKALRDKKRAAAPASTKPTRAAAPGRTKSIREMSEKEVDAVLDARLTASR